MEHDNHYWELKTKDGASIQIPPSAVDIVKRRWDAGQPIHTTALTVSPRDIVSFEKSTKIWSEVPLVEAAAQAFHEPIVSENGIVARWVKKDVTQGEFNQFYSKNPAYRKLKNDAGLVVVAFKLPVHLCDESKVQYCTNDDIMSLTNN